MKTFIRWFSLLALTFIVSSNAFAAAPDGAGPWADEVVSSNQLNTKAAGPVSTVNPSRSNPESTLGVAENDHTNGSTFFSLGFGGSVTLKFENGVRDGVIMVESTYPEYPVERASIDVSSDGATWISAGTVAQDGQVAMPEGVSCVNYVRVTDVSNADEFTEDTADGYDVDGVQAVNAESCDPLTTPTPTPAPSSNGDGGNGGSGTPPVCSDAKPGTPSITSVNRTSGTTAQVTWSAVTPVTHYVLSYGTGGSFQYGVPNTGNVTTFVIGGLDPGATYSFKVYGVNGCMPGDPSGDSSTGGVLGASTGGGDVLGASTDTLAATGSFAQKQNALIAVSSGLLTFAFILFMKRHHEAA